MNQDMSKELLAAIRYGHIAHVKQIASQLEESNPQCVLLDALSESAQFQNSEAFDFLWERTQHKLSIEQIMYFLHKAMGHSAHAFSMALPQYRFEHEHDSWDPLLVRACKLGFPEGINTLISHSPDDTVSYALTNAIVNGYEKYIPYFSDYLKHTDYSQLEHVISIALSMFSPTTCELLYGFVPFKHAHAYYQNHHNSESPLMGDWNRLVEKDLLLESIHSTSAPSKSRKI